MNKVHELFISGVIAANDLIQKTADTNSVIAGMTSAKNEFMKVVVFGVNVIIIPIISVGIAIAIVFAIAACVRKHNGQQTYTDKLIVIGICVAALALVLSFYSWGWEMLGITPS
ncbi:MAG: hypothetical protein ACERKO_04310 [Acetanaerobacterium sp.]